MEYAVTTRELTRKFGNFTAVDSLTINIRPGEIYGFLGPNGSGKTTTIRMLCGILEPTSGSGTVLGHDLAGEPEKIKQKIGYMSQKFSLYDDLTVYENLDFYAGLYSISRRERKERIREMIGMALLTGREKVLAGDLSGGWKQRLALGCAIISRPAMLFLDEPTSGVSPTSRRDFFKIIRRLAESGTTVMVTTHYMDEAERCHRIAFISGGRLIANDTPGNLKKNAIKGCMAEMEIPDPMNRLPELEALPYVRECSVHGAAVHILLDGEKHIRELEKHTGIKARVITPSLEDVFISLARKGRQAQS
ncbi:MAG: ABC transporter ATP-binding protein [Peptococcaceae bacterium]|nr:ABC transporter ATP-binding protein [Peptococcaceae bacterium]